MRRAPLAAALALVAACEPAPPPQAGTAAADTGLALVARREGETGYVVWGRTSAVEPLEISVEDGDRVLYGPAPLPVDGGAFRADFAIEPTPKPAVFVYVADAAGRRQWKVEVPRDRPEVRFGPAGEPPPLRSHGTTDRRVRASAAGVESERVRVRLPVAWQDGTVPVEGESRLPVAYLSVVRGGRVLGFVRVEGGAGAWRPFAERIPLPEPLREGDAVVVSTDPAARDRELVFQPIRN